MTDEPLSARDFIAYSDARWLEENARWREFYRRSEEQRALLLEQREEHRAQFLAFMAVLDRFNDR